MNIFVAPIRIIPDARLAAGNGYGNGLDRIITVDEGFSVVEDLRADGSL